MVHTSYLLRWLTLGVCVSLIHGGVLAQDNDLLLNHELYHYLDRLDIRGQVDTALPSVLKPYGREAVAAYLAAADPGALPPRLRDWHARMYLLADDDAADSAVVRGVWGAFFTNRRDLVHLDRAGLRLYVNPVLHTSAGLERTDDPRAARNPLPLYYNTRGLVVRGDVMGKVGFYTEVADNVMRFPQYIFNSYTDRELIPGEGFVKRFGDENGMDYFTTRAYLTWSPWRFLRIKFGKDRVHWGEGIQSLLLSDSSPDYLLLTLTARIWKLEYVSHYTQLIDFIRDRNDTEGTYPRKYGVFHQLSYRPNRYVSLSLFEGIVYQPNLANGRRGLEWQYLNPLIFYRAIEQYVGSPDNSVLGLQGKVNLLRHVQLYGQVLIDDYNFGVRDQGRGYWGNKVGLQGGVKYIDAFGLAGLDLQAEYNQVRPYTYQHFNTSSNYGHFGQPLGHAAGANLRDLHFAARYQPLPQLSIYLAYSQLLKGLDTAGINYGGDIGRPFVNRPGDFGQTTGQGQALRVAQLQGRASWQIARLDAWLELEGRHRREDDRQYTDLLLGLRAYLSPRKL
ncbi:MAG: hypothetical protein OHK0039_39720 [Bacteroidia bacterium]